MARNTNIKLRRSATHGAIPTTSNLDLGELALNTYDGKLYAKTTEGSASEIIQVGSATDSYHKIRKSLTLTFAVTVASKTTDHTWHGSGSSSAYFIDGLQSPHLHLVPGNKYRFDQSDSSNGGHPLRFYYDANKTTQYTTGITTNGTAGSSGAYTEITVSDDTPLVLHYQCSAHAYMGGRADFGTRNLTGFDTDDLSEGSSNLYYTDAKARSAISVSGNAISYNSSTGVITANYEESPTFTGTITVGDGHTIGDDASDNLLIAGSSNENIIIDSADDIILDADGGDVILKDGGTEFGRLRQVLGGLTITTGSSSSNAIIFDTSGNQIVAGDISLSDNKEVNFGTGDDLRLYSDGTNGIIKTDNGSLTLDIAGNLTIDVDGTTITLADGGTNFGQFYNNASGQFNIKAPTQDKDIVFLGNDGGTGITALTLDMSASGAAIFNNQITLGSGSNLINAGNMTIDVGGDLSFDADGGEFKFLDGGVESLVIGKVSGSPYLYPTAQDSDLVILGNDGGSQITALTLDMSNAGGASFNSYIQASGNISTGIDGGRLRAGGSNEVQLYFTGSHGILSSSTGNFTIDSTGDIELNADGGDITLVDGSTEFGRLFGSSDNFYIQSRQSDKDLIIQGNDGGSTITALSFDMSDGGAATFGDDVTITGNLTVSGTTTTLNSTTLEVADLNIVVGKNATSSSAANGAGITFGAWSSGTIPRFEWDHTNTKFFANYPIQANLVGNVTGTVSSLSNFDTGDLSEGSNLYYTNARADARIAAANISDLANVATTSPSSGQVLKWNGSAWAPAADLSGSAASNSFETIAVSGQSNVVADSSTDTLTLVAGTGMAISTNASSDTITFTSTATGTVTEAFKNIAVSGQSNIVADAAADTLTFAAGSGISLTTDASTDTLTITSTATGSVTEAFKTIAVSGSSDIVADSATDTLTLVAGSGMTITNNASSDTITFASSGGASQSGVFTEYTFTATSNQTTFTGSDDNNATLSYNASAVQVFLNGVLQENGTDYTASNGTSVVLVNAANSGDILQVSAYTQVLGFGDSALSELSGDGSTTAFTIAANPNHENNTQVYIDGVYQEKGTYSVSGTTLTFSSAPPNGTSIEVVIGSRNVTVDDVSGLTADSLTVDTITIDGSEIDATGNLTVDSGGVIYLDADGGNVVFQDAGTTIGTLSNQNQNFNLVSNVQDKDLIFKGNDGGSTITALTLDMSDAGTAIFNHDIKLADDGIAKFGDGDDLQIYHNGSASYIDDTGTGYLNIRGNGVSIDKYTGETMALFVADGAVTLYHNNSAKIATTATGIDVTGEVKGDSLDIDGNADISGNLVLGGNLTVSGSTTTINTATLDVEDKNITLNYGSGDTSSTADGAGITIQDAVNSSTDATILWDASNDEFDFSHALNVAGNVTLSNGSDIKSGDNFAIYDTGGSLDRFAFSTNSFYNVREGGYHKFTTHASGGSSVETLRLQNNRLQINNSSSIDNNAQLHITGYSSGHAGITMQDVDVTNGKTFIKQTSGATEIQTQNGSSHGIFKITGWNGSAAAEFMRVDSNGRLGVGTSVPSQPLDVRADENILLRLASTTSSNNARMVFAPNNSEKWNIGVNISNNDFSFYDVSNALTPVRFEDGAASNTLVVDSNSRIGIGTTSPGVSLDVGSKTDAIRVPNGTTAQRPTAALGQLRYNTTTSEFEGYAAGAWGKIGGGGDSFGTIAVSGQSNVVAEQENDTLTLVGTNGVTITTNASSDTVTIDGRTSYSPFTTDLFTTSNNSTTAFVLSKTPSSEDNLIVFLEGVYQNKNSYSLSSNTLTLDAAPASGEEVVVHIVGDVITGEALTRNNFTGDGSTTDFTLTLAPMNENNCYVYSDGVYQEKSEFSVSGTTLSFGSAPASGASLEVLIPKAATINTPATGSINDVAMYDTTAILPQTVTSTTVASTSATTIATHSASTYRTIKYLVQCTQGTDYHSTEINLIHDGSTVYITEYGTLYDNAALGTFDATISGGNILLKITAGSATSMGVKVVSSAVPV